MISIDNLIYNTLLSWEPVHLPKVGSLRLQFTAARQDGKKIIPPSAKVVFSKKKDAEAGSIVQLIASEGKVSLTKAKDKYDAWLEKFSGKEISIEGVGIIEENGTFTVDKDLHTLLNNNQKNETEMDLYNNERRCCKPVAWIIVVVAALIIGVGVYYFFCIGGCSFRCRDNVAVTDASTEQLADSTDMAVEEPIPAVVEEPQVQESFPYYIVAGVFDIPSNAARYSEWLKRKGGDNFRVEVLPFSLGRTVVTIYASNSHDDAVRFLRANRWINDEIWLWER